MPSLGDYAEDHYLWALFALVLFVGIAFLLIGPVLAFLNLSALTNSLELIAGIILLVIIGAYLVRKQGWLD